MPGQHLQETLHVHNHPIVKDVGVVVHLSGSDLLELPLDILLDLLASTVFLSPLLNENGIDSLLDSFLVAFLSDLYNFADDNVFEGVLQVVGLFAKLFDFFVANDLLLDLLDRLLEQVFRHIKAFLAAVPLLGRLNPLHILVLLVRKQLLSRVLDVLLINLHWQSHDVVKRDRVGIFDNLESVLVKGLL